MLRTYLLIAAGSGIGGCARFIMQQFVQRAYPVFFPWGTFTVNILGSLLLGMIYALAERNKILSPDITFLLATGFCGGFTTFSAFAFENIELINKGEFLYSGLYVLGSVLFGILAIYAGITSIKWIL